MTSRNDSCLSPGAGGQGATRSDPFARAAGRWQDTHAGDRSTWCNPQLTIKLDARNEPQALRSTVLQIEFDGKRACLVSGGAFFGRGYQSDPHRTWYTEVTEDGTMSCFWVMPYQKECKISLINLVRPESVLIERG